MRQQLLTPRRRGGRTGGRALPCWRQARHRSASGGDGGESKYLCLAFDCVWLRSVVLIVRVTIHWRLLRSCLSSDVATHPEERCMLLAVQFVRGCIRLPALAGVRLRLPSFKHIVVSFVVKGKRAAHTFGPPPHSLLCLLIFLVALLSGKARSLFALLASAH